MKLAGFASMDAFKNNNTVQLAWSPTALTAIKIQIQAEIRNYNTYMLAAI